MKIAVVSSYVRAHSFRSINRFVGGAEVYSLNLSIKLAEFKNEVTLFIGSKNTGEHIVNDKLRIKYVKTMKGPFGSRIPLSLINDLTSNCYDVIHMHQLFTTFSILSYFAGKAKKIPLIVTDHGGGSKPLIAMPYLCTRLPDAFVAVSRFSLSQLLRYAPNKKSFVVYGGVDTDIFHPRYCVQELKRKLDLDGFYVVLYVGRITRIKGIDTLIKALPYLPSNTKLLVVGGQEFDREYFKHLGTLMHNNCGKRIIFTGFVEKHLLPEFYNLCDVYVQPSVYYDHLGVRHRLPELLGLAKLEAMACGKPVIVSNVGGLPELITDGKNGIIVKAGDEVALANAINNLLVDEKSRKRMGENGLKLIRKKFTWDAIAKRVIKCYESILD